MKVKFEVIDWHVRFEVTLVLSENRFAGFLQDEKAGCPEQHLHMTPYFVQVFLVLLE